MQQDSASLRQRRYSRQSSSYSQDDTMIPLREADGSASLGRKRTPSGKSVVSRTISLAEYHEDLKPSLRHVSHCIGTVSISFTLALDVKDMVKEMEDQENMGSV